MQRLESVILAGVTALAGDIDDEPSLAALDGSKRGNLTVDVLHGNAEESGCFVFSVQGSDDYRQN